MVVGADDRLYVDDFADQGIVISFNPTIDASSLRQVLGTDNYPTGDATPYLSGLSVIGSGANAQICMTDENPSGSAGIIGWQLTDGVAAADDTGTVIVPLDGDSLTQAPYDLALDTNGAIYTIQYITPTESSANALIRFPPYQEVPDTTADWAVGNGLIEAAGVAVNPSATLIAMAVEGGGDPEAASTGALNLYCTNGNFMANIDETGGDLYYDVAWDNVGNLYALDGVAQVWRAYSPPGANQATTVGVSPIQVYNTLLPPSLCNPAVCMDGLRFTLAGQSNVTYVVERSCDLCKWCDAVTNFSTNANRCIFLPVSGNQNFYRAVTVPR